MTGKLIIIEAGDGCGKATQAQKLYQRLQTEGLTTKKVEFPDYNSDSSALIKMYLKGEFGKAVNDVNAYAASTFYAVDRFASYKTKWEDDYLAGNFIIADRYTTSNMVHQAIKIKDEKERETYLDWLWDLEFKKFKLPIPDLVIFLEMAPEYSYNLVNERAITENSIKDIHEQDAKYLAECYNGYCQIAKKYNWQKVNCIADNKIRTIDDIHTEIYQIVAEKFSL
jgi:dTMP kinase